MLLLGCASLAPAQTGWGLAVQDGAFTFTDLTRGRIARVESDGRLRVLIPDVHCHNLAPGYDGFIYGESVGTNRGGMGDVLGVWRLPPSGELEWVQPPAASPADGAWIARDAAGNTYGWRAEGIEWRIVRRAPDGSATLSMGRGGEFANVGGLAVSRAGVLYALDSGDLRRMAADGGVTTLARGIASGRTGGIPGRQDLFNHSVGLAVAEIGGQETVLVVDHYNHRVVAWNERDGARVLWSTSSRLVRLTNGGLGWQVTGVSVEGGAVYVLEALAGPAIVADVVGSPRIRRVGADGRSTIVAHVASAPVRAAAGTLAFGVVALVLYLGLRRKWRQRRRTPHQMRMGMTT